jgi:Flp pilus assembly pilin Flp
MTSFVRAFCKVRGLWKQTFGQDLIEYALMAGFVAVAAGAIMPGVSISISRIFSSVAKGMSSAATQGS